MIPSDIQEKIDAQLPAELRKNIEQFIDYFVLLEKREQARLGLYEFMFDAQRALLKEQMETLTPLPQTYVA